MRVALQLAVFYFKMSTVNGITFFYHSKVFSTVEQNYLVPEKEALAIFHCLQRMRTLVRRIERVASLIQEYRIAEMKHIASKSNGLADYLSRPSYDPFFLC